MYDASQTNNSKLLKFRLAGVVHPGVDVTQHMFGLRSACACSEHEVRATYLNSILAAFL